MTTHPIIDNSLIFTSEILHTKDLSSNIISTSSSSNTITINDDNVRNNIIICHKDKTSFYKAARKSRRTAQRVWSAVFAGHYKDENRSIHHVNVCDGYYVGKKQSKNSDSDSKQSSQFDSDAAIHKRLITEFGPCIDIIDDVCEDDVKVIKFNSKDDRGNNNDHQSGDEMSTNEIRVDVIFFDFDSVQKSSTMPQQIHLDLMQNVLTTMGRGEKNFIMHLKSETFYRAVISMLSSTNEKSSCSISGLELQKYILSNGGNGNDEGTTDAKPIRRLREKKGASNCPLTIYPARYIEIPSPSCASSSDGSNDITKEICRFHNYDSERGCLRSKKAQQNSKVKGCDMDHDHCHKCGDSRHRAFECRNNANIQVEGSVVFRNTEDGMISIPFDEHNSTTIGSASRDSTSLPALLVLGGRLRGRTLATCEMLPLSSSSSSSNRYDEQRSWMSLPNLREHRGSHAACSAVGCGVVFVMGGGTADGNSDDVEILANFGSTNQQKQTPLERDLAQDSENKMSSEWRWHTMAGKLSSPRHAFGAVSCVTSKQTINNDVSTSVSLFAVGGWKYGSVSCESLERLDFDFPNSKDISSSKNHIDLEWLYNHARWELCAPLLLPRRLHSVAGSSDGSSIYVFGGYIDERRTTPSIERYDVTTNSWSELDDLPFGEHNCPLVQAVADGNSFLVFPYSTEQSKEINNDVPMVLRYTPAAEAPFSPIIVPNNDYEKHLRLPIASWHSFSVTKSSSLNKVYLVGGTIKGKWTNRSYELDLFQMEWKELPKMTFARRRLATIVLE